MNNLNEINCLNCGKNDFEIPLISLRYRGGENWICSQCLPVLIHRAHELEEKLSVDISNQ